MLDDMYFQGDKGVPPACPTTGLFAIPFPNVDTDWVVHHSAIEDAHGSSVAEYDVKGGDHGPSISSMVQRDPKKKHQKAFPFKMAKGSQAFAQAVATLGIKIHESNVCTKFAIEELMKEGAGGEG